MYRQFTITDTEQKTIKFKVWPNLAKEPNKIVYDKLEIELKVDTNIAMLEMVDAVAELMDENTIDKIVVKEFEDGVDKEKELSDGS